MREYELVQRLLRFQRHRPRTAQIEAQNSAGAKAQVESRYPGAPSCSEIPACRGPEVLFLLVEVDPITGKISGQYPDAYPKDYAERVEKFCRNYIWRKITGDITAEFLEAAVDRIFSADEVTCAVDPAKLKRLKQQVVSLFLTR